MTRLHPSHLVRRLALARHPAWKWFYVGLGVKRWLVLLAVGITLLSCGIGYLLVALDEGIDRRGVGYLLTLEFIPRELRAGLLVGLGIGSSALALWKLNETLLSAVSPRPTNLIETLYRRRVRQRGLKIVCIGGGTGMSTLLRGLKSYTEQLTAIITVADDGGSSGQLRQELGVLPPGDFRQCIAALADAEPLMTRLLEYRFPRDTGLGGHAFGNLFIAAMAGVTGNSERALLESSRVLAVRGRILPSTLENVTLCAEARGTGDTQVARVSGESQIAKFGMPVERVYLEPERVPGYPGAIRALLEADLIIAGPGSLYTSVLPNLLVQDVCAAVGASPARKLFVCNVATERGETDHYAVEDYLAALEAHCGEPLFEHVLANNNWSGRLPPEAQIEFVKPRQARRGVSFADVVDDERPWRHDSDKLAVAIFKWYEQQTRRKEQPAPASAPESEYRKRGTREAVLR